MSNAALPYLSMQPSICVPRCCNGQEEWWVSVDMLIHTMVRVAQIFIASNIVQRTPILVLLTGQGIGCTRDQQLCCSMPIPSKCGYAVVHSIR